MLASTIVSVFYIKGEILASTKVNVSYYNATHSNGTCPVYFGTVAIHYSYIYIYIYTNLQTSDIVSKRRHVFNRMEASREGGTVYAPRLFPKACTA